MNSLGVVSVAGVDKAQTSELLFEKDYMNLTPTSEFSPGRSILVGQVSTQMPNILDIDISHRSRNNQMLLSVFKQIEPEVNRYCERYGKDRVGIVIGTSTSGIAEAEQAFSQYIKFGEWPDGYQYSQQEIGSPAKFLAELIGVTGPAYTISTACSSGAKALASAKRLLTLGLCDVVIAGGVDSLCGLTVQGFLALGALSSGICNPFSRNRDGINIGEGAALFVMSKEPGRVQLSGVGESSDAYHISAPDPTGHGAYRTMLQALDEAGCKANEVGYINLHGTGTEQNDLMESKAINNLFGDKVPCSSTKPLTGHCLGASGAIEAAFCWLLLQDGYDQGLPVHQWDQEVDSAIEPISLVDGSEKLSGDVRCVVSNSFAFGGNNVSLLMEGQSD